MLTLRASEAEHRLFSAAAEAECLKLTTWCRSRLAQWHKRGRKYVRTKAVPPQPGRGHVITIVNPDDEVVEGLRELGEQMRRPMAHAALTILVGAARRELDFTGPSIAYREPTADDLEAIRAQAVYRGRAV